MRRLTFAKKQRLVKNSQFRAVLDHRKRVSDGLLVMYMAPNDCSWARLGVSVGKACGSAVVRNRFKRLIREAFRLSQDQWPQGWDVVVMVNSRWRRHQGQTSERMDLSRIRQSFLRLRTKAERQGWFTRPSSQERGDD